MERHRYLLRYLAGGERSVHPSRVPHNFNPRDPKYTCCCKTYSVRNGAYTIAILHIMAAISGFILGCTMAQNLTLLSFTIPSSIIVCFVGGLMLFGIHAHAPQLLLPFLLLEIALVLLSGIFFIFSAINLSKAVEGARVDQQSENKSSSDNVSIGAAVLYVFLTLGIMTIEAWFFLVVLKAFRYLRDFKRAERLSVIVSEQSDIDHQFARLSAQYMLPPPPPAYSAEPVRLSGATAVGGVSPIGEAPPAYDDSCAEYASYSNPIAASSGDVRTVETLQNSTTKDDKPL